MEIQANTGVEVFRVDAFAREVFRGNPAMVCISRQAMRDEAMQRIASKFNVSETAFLSPRRGSEQFEIRWFTPVREVSLCGHATLAAAKVLFDHFSTLTPEIVFHSMGGILKTKLHPRGIALDFPLDEPYDVALARPYRELLNIMGITKYENLFVGKNTKKLVIHLSNQDELMRVKPDYEKMRKIRFEQIKGVGITALSRNEHNIVSRYFNPWVGVNEDPVTGSVHTLLAAYWARILGLKELKAYQASKRGGEMTLRLRENKRVDIIGDAQIVFSGELTLAGSNLSTFPITTG